VRELLQALNANQTRVRRPRDRRWLFVPYDQLTDEWGPLAREPADELGIVVVESRWKAARRPYHQQKLALVLANLRHFSLEQAQRGVAVRHVTTDGLYRDALGPLIAELGPLRVADPAERELREDLAPLVRRGGLEIVPHEGWLTTCQQFDAGAGNEPPWRMDRFYRSVRRDTDVLMDGAKPTGGKWSFDADNRRPWRGEPAATVPPRFRPDAITKEVGELVTKRFAHHPGQLDLTQLPATRRDAARLWRFARDQCLPRFGPFEDAMSVATTTLFHTRLSSVLNLQRLSAQQVLRDVQGLDIGLPSKEGFIRQLLGWREFVRHVHRATDGLRVGLHGPIGVARKPGDGGWGRWSGRRWDRRARRREPDGGAAPDALGADRPLPPAYWGAPSGLFCLDHVIETVWAEGYSHHITRLMVLANVAQLLDVSPRQLTDWFWSAYTDAYDWVVEPNVLGMGSFATGELMTTKPYVSGAGYIHRMSDYCRHCAFDPKSSCPLTRLYWAYLARHEAELRHNRRMTMPLASLRKRSAAQRRTDRELFERTSARLTAREVLVPGWGA
jgi:deoxyribodipyrimidine photolyase-related protein